MSSAKSILERRQRPWWTIVLTATIFLAVILAEFLSPSEVSHALLNVSLVATSLLLAGRWTTPVVALFATVISCVDIWKASSNPGTPEQIADIYLGIALVWIAAALVQYRKRADTERSLFLQRARQQQAAVVALATNPAVVAGNIQSVATRASELMAEHLDVGRASVWFLSEARDELRLVNLYEAGLDKHSSGIVLKAADYPRYFAALESGRAIDAHDARTDPRTSEYTPGYLVPLGITSMLDACIRVGGKNYGVVCCEQVGPKREWQAGEVAFAGEIADQIAQAVAHEEKQRAHEKELANERRYRDIVETSNDLIWSTDTAGRITFVNRAAAERIYGYTVEEMVGRKFADFMNAAATSADPGAFDRVLKGEPLFAHEVEHRRKDGRQVRLSFNAIALRGGEGEVVGTTGTAADITARLEAEERRRELEEQLRHSQKMEALGRLAGGIAHDFNNILGAILMNAEMVTGGGSISPGGQRFAETIVKAAQRGKSLISQILAFSRQVRPSSESIDVGALVGEIEQLIRVTLPQQIVFSASAVGAPHIAGDPAQLTQVLMNLCTNAVYAMKERGGVLQLDVEGLAARDVEAARRGKVAADRVVRLRVSDTGAGIPPEVREKIFEPFFSTKPVGEGTGLGLSVVLGIVESHGGHIHLESEPGLGTTFELYFPEVDAVERPVPANSNGEIRGGAEHVLIVDDELMVLDVSAAALRQYGYTVAAFAAPEEAARLVERGELKPDILVTDLTMPRVTGIELARRARQVIPDLPVVLCSGYDLTRQSEEIEAGLIAMQISKPYSVADLLKVVRPILDARVKPEAKVLANG